MFSYLISIDIYHSSLGLAALSRAGEASLKRLDSALCVSVEARAKAQVAMEGIINAERDRGSETLQLETPEWLSKMAAKLGPQWVPNDPSGPPSYLHRYAEENLVHGT